MTRPWQIQHFCTLGSVNTRGQSCDGEDDNLCTGVDSFLLVSFSHQCQVQQDVISNQPYEAYDDAHLNRPPCHLNEHQKLGEAWLQEADEEEEEEEELSYIYLLILCVCFE